MNYRKKETVPIITFPVGIQDEDRGLKLCCKPCFVLGDVSDPINYKNDVTGVYIKKSDVSDTVTFTIEKCGTTGALTNLGDVGIFPQDDLLVGFIFDWRQYLSTYGAGLYTITIDFTISGVTGGYTYGLYELLPYSIQNAAGTVRMYSEFNSYYWKDRVDFSNSNFKDSIRFRGFFGDMDLNTEINNLIDKGRKVVKTTREDVKLYTLTTSLITDCIARRMEFHLLNEDSILMSDHNAFNFSYQYFDKKVVLEEPAKFDYKRGSRYAVVSVTFSDRDKVNKSFYNIEQ